MMQCSKCHLFAQQLVKHQLQVRSPSDLIAMRHARYPVYGYVLSDLCQGLVNGTAVAPCPKSKSRTTFICKRGAYTPG